MPRRPCRLPCPAAPAACPGQADAFALWDAKESLFWRDDSYVGRQAPNGRGVFWARGNGWAFAAMARKPQGKQHPTHHKGRLDSQDSQY